MSLWQIYINNKTGDLYVWFLWLFFFRNIFALNELFFPTLKKTVFPHEYEPHKCFVRIWPSFYSQNLLLCCLRPAGTYWNTDLWHHHEDWNPHLNALLNLNTPLKPNTCLRTLLGSIYTLTLRSQHFCFTVYLLTVNSQFTCTVSPYCK